MFGPYSHFFARAHLVSHVNCGCWIIADAHGRETRLHGVRVFEPLHLICHFAFNLIGDNRAVQ
jgi:hypothetical protein